MSEQKDDLIERAGIEAKAWLNIEVFVNCPNCDYLIDLMRPEDTSGYDHNEEGQVINQACPDGHWMEKHKNFEVEGVCCSECETEFNVKEIEW